MSAIEKHFPGSQWQRCQVHFKKNVLDKVRGRDKAWIKSRLDDIFLAPDKETGFTRLQQLVADLADRYPGFADFFEAEEWLTGRQYLDMSLLEGENHKHEADLKLDPAPWRGDAVEPFLQNF